MTFVIEIKQLGERKMKKLNLKKQFVRLFAVLTIAGTFAIAIAAQTKIENQKFASETGRCRENTLNGSYGTNITGTFVIPSAPGSTNPPTIVPLASVGLLTFNGAGNVSGNDTNSFGGDVTRYSVTGVYTVNRDCTGTLNINLPNGFVITNDIVIVEEGKQINLIQTNPGTIVTGVLKRQ